MGIEQRLENWSRTVRDPRWQPQCCASWAKLATALRDAEKGVVAESAMPRDVHDGWLVERAWQKIADPISKRLLQLHYVHQFPPEIVCRILVRKYGASHHTLKHWKVRLAKAHAIAVHLIDSEAARVEMAATVKRMQQAVAV
ncbi:hypothetical protein 8G_00070 [Ralstonia phage Hyacinthe]|uniref:Bacteriophage protein n=3 Tax=Rahariannevirus raharianne TaxID=2846050 RepID=A0A7G5BBB0_9CAUD|nr:hypothetical protein KMC43_gp14 [Ralstonia phage Raharianne]QMV32389.1 hypothetical protein U2_00014 [Ralstonia phage Albius]QMV33502.1 hypothetical protein 8G_00070 [Ralstonia phage Hyacinthe]QMV33583.1 hypothetical protein Y2_00014 [Ralstonia phage Raharianne]